LLRNIVGNKYSTGLLDDKYFSGGSSSSVGKVDDFEEVESEFNLLLKQSDQSSTTDGTNWRKELALALSCLLSLYFSIIFMFL
jgi:hypothetical protein